MKHFRWLPAGILVLLWWGVLFPETALTQDAYRVLDAKGNEIELSEEDRKEVYGKLLQADPSQVKYKSILWEWLQELKDEDYEEEGMKKQAKIKVTGTSVIEGEELVTETEAMGICEKKETEYILTYQEETQDGAVQNEVCIGETCVTVKKRGVVEADMKFEPGARHAFGYKTEQGEIPFVASGGRIRYNEEDCCFITEFDYMLSVGDFMQECSMRIEAEYV